MVRSRIGGLVAVDHILRYALRANDSVSDPRQRPQLAVVLSEIVSCEDRSGALYRSYSISPCDGRMRAVKVCRLHLRVANTLLVSQPVFSRKQCGVGICESGTGRDHRQAKELLVNNARLEAGRGEAGCRHRRHSRYAAAEGRSWFWSIG